MRLQGRSANPLRILLIGSVVICIFTTPFLSSCSYPGEQSSPIAEMWATTLGGGGGDYLNWIRPTSDGGFIAVGATSSFGAGNSDAWIVKLDAAGSPVWQKTYGGAQRDHAVWVETTADGGFLVAGTTSTVSTGNDWTSNAWVLKLDSNGQLLRVDRYGGTLQYAAVAVQPLPDGGYVLAGASNLILASAKLWLVRADSAGSIVWQRSIAGAGPDEPPTTMQLTGDGGYVVAGRAWRVLPDLGARVLKFDENGNVVWRKFFEIVGGLAQISAIGTTDDGGYIIAGRGSSPDPGRLGGAWVAKLNAGGDVVWQKLYGAYGYESAQDVQPTPDGGYVVAGYMEPFLWLFKLDGSGNLIWQRTFSGGTQVVAYSIRLLSDGFVAAGSTRGALILRLDQQGTIPGCSLMGTSAAIVTDASVSVTEAPLSVVQRDAVPISSAASVGASLAVSSQQCYSAGIMAATNAP